LKEGALGRILWGRRLRIDCGRATRQMTVITETSHHVVSTDDVPYISRQKTACRDFGLNRAFPFSRAVYVHVARAPPKIPYAHL